MSEGDEDRVVSRLRRKRGVSTQGKKNEVYFGASECRYECILEAVRARKWKIVDEEDDDECNVYWIDVANIYERMARLKPWQYINHFPGTSQIARKNRLAWNLEKMRREFPKEYSFYPKTWVLPSDMHEFRAQFDAKTGKSSRFFIIKPEAGCQGKGIFLTQDFADLKEIDQVVAQEYIRKPMLIDNYKFDLRLYVLITSIQPLRIYLFRDGLVRLCTEEYVKPNAANVDQRCMHLTNYSINKHSEKFQTFDHNEAKGSKRSLNWFMRSVQNERGDAKSELLWRRMGAICVKTILSILPTLRRDYHSLFPSTHDKHSHCFEILGIDVIIDQALKPWLVEVNHLPSFSTDASIDLDIKSRVITQTLAILQAQPHDRTDFETNEKNKTEDRLYNPTTPTPTTTNDDANPSTHTAPLLAEKKRILTIRRKIEAIFLETKPEHIVRIEGWLRKYAGREEALLKLVEKKYTSSPSSSEDAPEEEEEEEDEPQDEDRPQDEDTEEKDDASDDEIEREENVLIDFDRIYPIPRDPKKRHHEVPSYAQLKRYVLELDNKRYRRRASLATAKNSDSLPRLLTVAGECETTTIFTRRGSAFYDKPKPLPERTPLPKPGPNQLKAAERLTQGYSTAKMLRSSNNNHEAEKRKHPQSAKIRTEIKEDLSDQGRHHIRLGPVVTLQPTTFVFFNGAKTTPLISNKTIKRNKQTARNTSNTSRLDPCTFGAAPRYDLAKNKLLLPQRHSSSNVIAQISSGGTFHSKDLTSSSRSLSRTNQEEPSVFFPIDRTYVR